jgi:hypothetical protein
MHIETLTWYTPAERMPDSESTVLMRMPEGYSEPVWIGFTDGEVWFDENCMTVDRPVMWAELPEGGAA